MFKHLQEKKMDYWSHGYRALHTSYRLILCSGKLAIHAVYPDFFKTDVSEELQTIVTQLTGKKSE